MMHYMRHFLIEREFCEIHTPKLLAGGSETGTQVFETNFYGTKAFLAQSPQLHKQMAVMGDFERVFEVGPVFRAEDSNTNRHLCEFTGLDVEMRIEHSFFEVIELLENLLNFTFDKLETHEQKLLNVVRSYIGQTAFKLPQKVTRIHFKDAVKLLNKSGVSQNEFEDFSSETEKALGKLLSNE